MLFVESKIFKKLVEGEARLDLLEKLQERGLTPLIRSTRLSCYDTALLGPERAKEMERMVSAWTETEGDAPYINGDVFCFEDFTLFLIFGDASDTEAEIRAGIVYEAETTEPARKLDDFCRNLSDALQWQGKNVATQEENGALDTVVWRERTLRLKKSGFEKFADSQETAATSVDANGKENWSENRRAIELLNETEARRSLRRIREKHADGRTAELLINGGNESEATSELTINKLREAGLLRREVLVSCRKKDRALFRLPSPDTLAVVMASNATCSECGIAIADEKVEELIAPTQLAHTLLENGAWLVNHLRTVLREAGIAEAETVVGAPSGEGESHVMANVCSEPFLFVLRDGDWTSHFARRALDKAIETEATHLVVIATGKVHEDGRVRLRDGARRRAQEGNGFEVILIEGADRAAIELQHAFERVSQKRLMDELCELDRNLGLSVGQIIAARFQLRGKSVALKDLAASAAGALAGNFREF